MPEIAEPTIIPPRLKPGATIGLITPAGPIRDHAKVRSGIAILEGAGFKVKLPGQLSGDDYLAGSDEERAGQLAGMWDDPEVGAVMAVRGGYGVFRLLPYLDPTRFRENPKILAGFSDITILLNEIQRRTGLVTYHTPMLTTLAASDEPSRQAFIEILTGSPRPISPPKLRILTGGSAGGRLIGGNLASLCHLLGTPHEPLWDGAILFIEDVGEPVYKIDRMLTQLRVSGRMGRLNGMILGSFSADDEREGKWPKRIWERAAQLTGGNMPLWGNFPVGHGARNLSLPVGMTVIMDSTERRLEFIKP
ncbi:MAG: LD-carboxypeptidase [Desulfurivibrionaceae bacterium]|nr:LD-carboxypeptidase [Desulfurivibrionaceae bacterium]